MHFTQFFCVSAAFAIAGCSSNVVPVSGTVTLNNKPLPNATVIFQPDTGAANPGPGSHGKTDKNGRFTLQLMNGNASGAIVGKHKVSITAYEGDGDDVPSSGADSVFRKALVPTEYNANTRLTFTVPASGSDTADFALTSKDK
jgi:hypothetical protein